MSKKILFFVALASLLCFAVNANAAPVAIGNPNSGNGWSTTSAVTVTSSDDAGTWGMAAANMVNGSGLDPTLGMGHSNVTWSFTHWLTSDIASGKTSASGQSCNVWIEFSFDKAYDIGNMWVWNYNAYYGSNIGLKDVTIDYSADGVTWNSLGNYELAQATVYQNIWYDGNWRTINSDDIAFGGVSAKYVVISATSNWGHAGKYGLAEVRFYEVPEPMTIALLGFGALALFGKKRTC